MEQKRQQEEEANDERIFIEHSKKFVHKIENYKGDDPLRPWHNYLIWLEGNYIIDFSDGSLYMDLLCRCLAAFESNERYKQDRRLIKMFILYISYQDDPEEHFELMHENGVGTRVADLYICWAHFYNTVSDYTRAEEIFQKGFAIKASPSDILRMAHEAFTVNKGLRIQKQSDPDYERKCRKSLRKKYNDFIRLSFIPHAKDDNSNRRNLPELDRIENIAIPFVQTKSVLPTTPDQKPGTSLIQSILNSCSARKKTPHTRSTSLRPTAGSRLNFDDENVPAPKRTVDTDNLYELGIQLPKGFVRASAPQKIKFVPPVRDDGDSEPEELTIPMYDKIMLMPAAGKVYSPEELRAYNWFKRNRIANAFTKAMDPLWSNGMNVPFRQGKWLVTNNLPQKDEFDESERDIVEHGVWQFGFDLEKFYPKDGSEELSCEELMWKKRLKSTKKPSSVMRKISQRKIQRSTTQMPSNSSITMSQHGQRDAMDVEASQILGRKPNQPDRMASEMPELKKLRKSSFEFKELNETCSTMLFGMHLKKQAASTPNAKTNFEAAQSSKTMMYDRMSQSPHPIPEIMVTDFDEPRTTAAVTKRSDKNVSNSSCDMFIDDTIPPSKSGTKAVAAGPTEFEIYRDETKLMNDLIQSNAQKQITPASTTEKVNDENLPVVPVTAPVNVKPATATSSTMSSVAGIGFGIYHDETIRPKVAKPRTQSPIAVNRPAQTKTMPHKITASKTQSHSPLKDLNVIAVSTESLQQSLGGELSFALFDGEKELMKTAAKKVNFSFDYANGSKSSSIIRYPGSIDEVDEEDDENDNSLDLHGRSIYIPREEEKFCEAKHADWKEATLHLAEGPKAKNEYVVEPIDMNETQQIIDTQLLDLFKLSPFNPRLQKALLDSISFIERLTKLDKTTCSMVKILQPIRPKTKLTFGIRSFSIHKLIGTGSFGQIFSGECRNTKSMLAFKQERPPNMWEYYICQEVQKRIGDRRIRNACMSIEHALIGNNATIFVSKFAPYGSLLSVCNIVKSNSGRNLDEYLVMIFAKQMLTIVDALHRSQIIHADIKPDNFLLMNQLDHEYEKSDFALQLIDFGQSIDMKLFPKSQMFYSKLKTQNFVCTEMMDDRPWTFQTDLFCLASTIYTLLLGEYMVVRKANKKSSNYITRTIPRYYNKKLWTHLLDVLINIPDPRRMPDLLALRQLIDDEIRAIGVKAIRQKITDFNKAVASN